MAPVHRRALTLCVAVVFVACTVCAVRADADLSGVAAALTTKLTSDDTFRNAAGKVVERQLAVRYSARASGPCTIVIHRDATSNYPYLGHDAVVSETKAVTYYMVPLDKMSDQLAVANADNGQQAATYISGASHAQVFTYSEDTTVPLSGMKADVEPAAVSSEGPVPKYPTFTDAAMAKSAIATLAKAAATCATSASK
jgi:hypothetical protein